jgi:GNAT superfamily N-acetyltransferase
MYKGFEPKRIAQGLPVTDVPRIAHWLDDLQRISRALLAWDEKRVVAHAVLCPIRSDCVEFTIFVHQDCRQQGLGTSHGELALEWARPMAFRDVYPSTETSNARALRLFYKLGFQMVSSAANECEMKLELVERRAA